MSKEHPINTQRSLVMTKQENNNTSAKTNATQGVNSESNKILHTTKDTASEKVLYGAIIVIFGFLFFFVLENDICDNGFDFSDAYRPEECPSTHKLVFNHEKQCYDTITLAEAERRFGIKGAEALKDFYTMDVTYDSTLNKYSRHCVRTIEPHEECNAIKENHEFNQEDMKKLKKTSLEPAKKGKTSIFVLKTQQKYR